MQNITESEFQREVEALKSHRRLSVNRPLLDPDLPEIAAAGHGRDPHIGEDNSSLLSPSASLGGTPMRAWNRSGGIDLSDEGPSSHSGSLARRSGSSVARPTFSARRRGGTGATVEGTAALAERPGSSSPSVTSSNDDVPLTKPLDPSHLFWVPASMHPEISPSDFRKFLHDHASRAVREQQEAQEVRAAAAASVNSGQRSPTSPVSGSEGSVVRGLEVVSSPVEALKNRSTSIARRGSTLRRQYRPENDEDPDAPLHSSSSNAARISRTLSQRTAYRSNVPELSIDDLQNLERLAEAASKSSDPSELRSVLRRTMSLNVSPSALDQVDAVPLENEQDAPLIVPRPGQILRRAARTKIRKSSFSMDAPNLGSRRRRPGPAGELADIQDLESPDKRESSASDESAGRLVRPQSDGANDSVLDIYSRDSYLSDDTQRTSVTSLADSLTSGLASPEEEGSTDGQSHAVDSPLTPTLQSAQGRQALRDGSQQSYFNAPAPVANSTVLPDPTTPTTAVPQVGRREAKSSSEPAASLSAPISRTDIKPVHVQHIPPVPAFENIRPAPQPPTQQQTSELLPNVALSGRPDEVLQGPPNVASFPHTGQRLAKSDTMPNMPGAQPTTSVPFGKPAKEKKSGFGLHWLSNWSKDDENGDKSSKKERKGRKEREREAQEQTAPGVGSAAQTPAVTTEKEKDSSGFLGSLFGRKKGSDETGRPQEFGSYSYGAATGTSHVTSGSLLDIHGKMGPGEYHYNRYPIHIERAVYRLSHIKLANPRRPLYEQVLISNLMFWYLSVINRTQQQQQQQQQQQELQRQHQLQASQTAPVPDVPPEEQPSSIVDGRAQPQAYSQQHDNGGISTTAPVQLLEAGQTSATAYLDHATPALLHSEPDEGDEAYSGDDADAKSMAASLEDSRGGLSDPSQPPDKVGILEPGSGSGNASQHGVAYGGNAVSARHGSSNSVSGGGVQTAIKAIASSVPSKTKRSGLVKPNRAPPGARSAERAIPAAAYGAQHRQINSEMAAVGVSSASPSTGSGGGGGGGGTSPTGSNGHVAGGPGSSERLSPTSGPLRMTGRSVSGGVAAQRAATADEHAWLGSQRRSPGAEDRRSDPLSDVSRTWKENNLARKGGHRVSEPVSGGSNGGPAATVLLRDDDEKRMRGAGREAMAYSNGVAGGASRGGGGSFQRTGVAAPVEGLDAILPQPGSKETSAMLDAARLSQSRRR